MPHEIWQAVEKHTAPPAWPSSAIRSPSRCCARSTKKPGRYDLSSMVGITLVRRDVERGGEGGPASDTFRRSMLTDSFASTEAMGMGIVDGDQGRRARRPPISWSARTPSSSTRTTSRSSPAAARRAGRVRRRAAARLLQGRGEDRAHLPHHRTASAIRFPATTRSSKRTDSSPARPRQQLHQHRRRESVSRRGRGGAEDASRRRGRAGARRAGREMGPGGHRRRRAVATAPRSTKAICARMCARQLAGYKTPKRILIAGVALRAPNGKADYKAVGEFARRELGISP